MKSLISVLVLPFLLFLVSCDGQINNISSKEFDSYSILKDSINLFQDVVEENINGEIEGINVSIHFYSIPEKEFLSAIKRNRINVRYFNINNKVNEYLGNNIGARNKSFLSIGGKFGYLYLVDLKENKFHMARNFFLENKIGDFFILKRIQFEDAETIFWNSKTGNEELVLDGISVSTSKKDSLIFYSSTFKVIPEDTNPICLLKIREEGIDTLFYKETDWFTNFSFFDERDSSIYYIHKFYQDYKIKSIYAKMDFYTLPRYTYQQLP